MDPLEQEVKKFTVVKDYTLVCNRCGWFTKLESRTETFIERILHRCIRIDTETNYGI